MDEFSKELLPCPFCGAAAKLEEESDHHGEFYNLGCSDDKCFAHHVCYTWTPEDAPVQDATAKWNTRSDAAYSLGLAKGRKDGMELIVWLASNYAATLSGRVVRDADECLAAAQQFIRQAAQGGEEESEFAKTT